MKLKKTHISNKKFEKLITLPKLFPYRLDWRKTLIEFALSSNYWKIPKTYSINEERIDEIVKIIRILELYDEGDWGISTQKSIYKDLKEKNLIDPYISSSKQKITDYTALIRIISLELEFLGLAWTSKRDKSIHITKAGTDLTKLKKKESYEFIGRQILKFQFQDIKINPCIFLAKLFEKIDYRISKEEWIIFLNMCNKMEHEKKCSEQISKWRSLSDTNRNTLLDIFKKLPRITSDENLFGELEVYPTPRYLTIDREYSYQRSFILYPFKKYLIGNYND